MTLALILTASLLAASGNARPLPAPALRDSVPAHTWDAARRYPSADSLIQDYTRKWFSLEDWYRSQDGSLAARLEKCKRQYALKDGFRISLYDHLTAAEKNARNLNGLYFLAVQGHYADKPLLQRLFNEFPAPLHDSQMGRNISAILLRMHASEGRNVRPLLETARIRTTGQESRPLWASMQASRYKLMIFGASWCGPCKFHDAFIHQAAKQWQPAHIQIYHLSLDDKPEKWLADASRQAPGAASWLVPGAWNAPLAKQLQIRSVPAYILTDEHGTVLIDENYPPHLLARIDQLLEQDGTR